MSTSDMDNPLSRKVKLRKLLRCERCRRDDEECHPRTIDPRCDRCFQHGWECGPRTGAQPTHSAPDTYTQGLFSQLDEQQRSQQQQQLSLNQMFDSQPLISNSPQPTSQAAVRLSPRPDQHAPPPQSHLDREHPASKSQNTFAPFDGEGRSLLSLFHRINAPGESDEKSRSVSNPHYERRISKDEWRRHKQTLRMLNDMGLSRQQILDVISKDFGDVKPTYTQLCIRLDKWGLYDRSQDRLRSGSTNEAGHKFSTRVTSPVVEESDTSRVHAPAGESTDPGVISPALPQSSKSSDSGNNNNVFQQDTTRPYSGKHEGQSDRPSSTEGNLGLEANQLLDEMRMMPPTDSGYASYKPTHNSHQDHQNPKDVVTDQPDMAKSKYAATSYSDNLSLETSKRDTFVEKFAEQLVTDLGITFANAKNALRLCDEIAGILAEFALKLGHGNSVNELQRAMVFIHKYRREITSHFRSIALRQDPDGDYEDDEIRPKSDVMPLGDKMQMYHDSMVADPVEAPVLGTDDETHPGNLGYDIENEQPPTTLDDIEDFNKYLSYVCKTPHYEWLLATSRCKITLTSSKPISLDIRRSILSTLPQDTNVRRLACRHSQALFSVPWEPQQVLEQKWRSFDPRCAAIRDSTISPFTLGDVLTITGESSEAQALSCDAYLTQTWPMTGRFILQLVETVVIHGIKNRCSARRADGTEITVSQGEDKTLRVLVSGTKYAIAEVGEQLAWLGAALRCSPMEQGLVYCTASISSSTNVVDNKGVVYDTNTMDTEDPLENLRLSDDQSFQYRLNLSQDYKSIFSFDLSFEFEETSVTALSSGTCWQHLFQSPVIARGFPVMRRAQPYLGLEMPLNVIGGLLGTTYVNTFGDGVFLKGHSAIVYATQVVEDVVVWHLDYSSTKRYIPYPSKDHAGFVKINPDQLARSRQIIGWCRVVENRTGIAGGCYKTQRSKLGGTNTGCVLDSCALSFGNRIVGVMPYTLLNSHDSLQIRRKSYSTMLNYLSTRFVVFFDVRDRRGWLVNGVNALYHILRSSLEEDRTRCAQNQNSSFVLRPNQLVEPEDPGAASAAWRFLDNRDNLFCKLALSNVINKESDRGEFTPHDGEYETLAHRLEQFHDALEVLFNYQTQAEESCRRQKRSRANYEGWDFVDVTRRRNQKPRMMRLPLQGLACADLLRSARAITLFGNGFDELILPSSQTCCSGWRTLPKMRYYIASSTADVQKLIEEEGEMDPEPRGPPQLSCIDRIMWYSPQASLNDCGCGTGDISLASLVQVPWPRKYRSLMKDVKGPGQLEAKGAVVFGYNSIVPWHWPEIGDPRPGPPPPELEAEDSDEDSALGSSIESSATERSLLATTVPHHMLDYARSNAQFPSIEQSHNSYGNATVHGGRNVFGDTYHQIINNYQQQTTDISVQGIADAKTERKRGMTDFPVEATSKRQRFA